jgi:hypothetical protein
MDVSVVRILRALNDLHRPLAELDALPTLHRVHDAIHFAVLNAVTSC